jgi:hypothetical protein
MENTEEKPAEKTATVNRHWAFAVPFFTTVLPDAAALNQRLIAELNSSRPLHTLSHVHNGRAENTYVDPAHVPSVATVFNFAESIASKLLGKPLVIPRHMEPGPSYWFWFNETAKRGGVTNLHNHWSPWTYFSGCYYVKVPPKSGNLVFSRARSQTVFDGKALPEAAFFADVEIPPGEGLLILFPSWVEHLVRPNQTDEPRISLAFNLCLPDGQKGHFTASAVVRG